MTSPSLLCFHTCGEAMEEGIVDATKQPAVSVMSNCPLSVLPEASIHDVLERFSKQGNHPLIVIDHDGTVSGVITMIDLIQAITPGIGFRGKHLIGTLDRFLKSTAKYAIDLVSDELLTLPQNATISDALRRMEHTHSSSLIVVNEKNIAIGCVELSDIIAHLHRSVSR